MAQSSGSPDEDTLKEALVASRRVYDNEVRTLENIDDKALRGVRTSVLILGAAASALAVAGPSALSDAPDTAVALAFVGGSLLVVAAFIGVGIVSITRYPLEIRDIHRRTARHLSRRKWLDDVLNEYEETIEGVNNEIRRNASYLTLAQLALLSGTALLLISGVVTTVAKSYDWPPTGVLLGIVVVWAVVLLGGVRLMDNVE